MGNGYGATRALGVGNYFAEKSGINHVEAALNKGFSFGKATVAPYVGGNLGFRPEAGFTDEGRVGVKGSIKF